MLTWTPEKDAELRKLHSEHSFAEIAAALGVSRNSAIGRAGRLGLSKPRCASLSESERKARRVASKKAWVEKKALRKINERTTNEIIIAGGNVRFKVVTAPRPLKAIDIEPLHITLMDLTPSHCRYPYGDSNITFCGHEKVKGTSYCAGHFKLCWVEPVNRFGAKSKVAA